MADLAPAPSVPEPSRGPGLVVNFHLADAVLGPEIARRTAWASRHALDATVRGLGFGERAARAEASARVDQARFRQLQTMDRAAREVVEAKAQVDARGKQILVAADAVRAAESSYRLNSQRISELQGLPIETLQAIQALDAAQRDYLRAVTEHNEAQFRLHRALGWPIGA